MCAAVQARCVPLAVDYLGAVYYGGGQQQHLGAVMRLQRDARWVAAGRVVCGVWLRAVQGVEEVCPGRAVAAETGGLMRSGLEIRWVHKVWCTNCVRG